ncbi:peroxiredoxin [Streptomyces sp. NPDC004111]|uniref:peroxiredoxin n=1 Tax=Streptomyces sp. NPDC004111 TaxID=3364690 RepID=UPI0036C905C4
MAASPAQGDAVPEFTLPGGVLVDGRFERSEYALRGAPGRPLVLAFYPGDDTAVCTKQLCSYSSGLDVFAAADAEVWGISSQDLDSHEAFARKHGLKMPLLADPDRKVARMFGITAPGIGVRRAVFIVAPDGTLRWKHVALLGATFRSTETIARELEALKSS